MKLEADVSPEEVQLAIGGLKGGKAPGADGLPSEFYSNFMEILAPKLTTLLSDHESLEALPDSMNEAVIVLVPKPGKDPQDCSSYRPISLLNVDAKIFTKILANRLTQVIEDLVDIDQTGFMPGKGTDINIRRLFLNTAIAHENIGSRVIASLYAEKAFNSVEWPYLWEVLRKFGFSPKFINGIQLFYQKPRAWVRTNNWLSEPFPLFRGTRQGCSLSPSLFSLALEPLALLIRSAPDVLGLRMGKLEERLSLYADHALFYLNDAGPSLLAALGIFDRFGGFSGIQISWTKSVLFHDGVIRGAALSPLRWVDEFCYLGVLVTKSPADYMSKKTFHLSWLPYAQNVQRGQTYP